MQVFISHSSKDKPIIRELIAELPRNLGLWLDEDQLAFDRDLSCRLKDVISIESDFVLAFLSRHSRESKWVEREFTWAMEEEKRRGTTFVLPILLEDIRDHPGFSDLALRQHLRIIDSTKMGMRYSAQKLERMMFTLIMNRLPKSIKTLPERALQVSADYADSTRSNRLLIVREGSKSSKRYAVIKCCPDLGLKPTVVDSFSTKGPHPFDVIDSDPLDWERLLPILEQRLESLGRFQNVVTFEELDVVNTARLAQYLGCERRLSVSAAKRCRDKFLARTALAEADIPQVKFCIAASYSEAAADISHKGLRYPLVVKPRNGAASVGVERVNAPAELESAFKTVRSDVARVRTGEGGRWRILDDSTLLIEEYIEEGDDIEPREMSVEGVVNDGQCYILAMHEKLEMRTRPPYFEPIFISPPLPEHYTKRELESIEELIHRALGALGVEYGPFHAELRMGRDGPIMLEVGARPGGGIIPESILKRRGVDIRSLALKIATGTFLASRDIPKEGDTATCLGIVYPEERGVLQNIGGMSEAELNHRGDVFIAYPITPVGTEIIQEELTWLLDVGTSSDKGPKDAYERFCGIRSMVEYEINGRKYRGRNLAKDFSFKLMP